MGKYTNINKELQRMLDKAEELDWSYEVYADSDRNEIRAYVEMEKHSPAGEDFSMIIDFEPDNQAETFLEKLLEHNRNFDIYEHVEKLLPCRGKGGCPSTSRELAEDALAIAKMLKELYKTMRYVLHPELSEEQLARCDEIYNAVYEMCKVVADEKLEWDTHYIGEIAELSANIIANRGHMVNFPAVVTDVDGTQHIEEYYRPEERKFIVLAEGK